jgi:hypothetical protein
MNLILTKWLISYRCIVARRDKLSTRSQKLSVYRRQLAKLMWYNFISWSCTETFLKAEYTLALVRIALCKKARLKIAKRQR